jgi:anti-sigma regulatory factor (Ser/Thr protein kinase)
VVTVKRQHPEQAWSYALELPHDPRAPRIARTTLRAVLTLHGLGGVLDCAELLASEMVTNAYQHTGGPSSMRLRNREERLRVGVWDTDPYVPPPFDHRGRPRPAEAGCDENGRGLLLVPLCASDWGGYALGEEPFGASGKLLWFEVAHGREAFGVAV